MDVYSKIKATLREMQVAPAGGLIVGEVVSVDDTVCRVRVGSLELSDVRLRAVVNGEADRLLVTPKAGSRVLMHDLSGGLMRSLVIVKFSEVEKINIRTGDTAIDITDGKVEINGGGNGGLINIEDLKKNLDQLKNYVEALNTAVSNGLSAVGESTAASGAAAQAAYESAMAGKSINFQDMEDTKITH